MKVSGQCMNSSLSRDNIALMNHSQGTTSKYKNCVIGNSSLDQRCYVTTYIMNVFSQWALLPCCLYSIHNICDEP